ncbi:MAG: HDOD domain-containing protein [Nitrosomonadales bacterium]|nr:HDOD domain-containing protein [Nitrosomonadales bacterium]
MSVTNQPVGLKAAIKHLDALPAMPVVVQKILTLSLDTDEGERELLKLIDKDPQIAAKIIGLANTPLFGSSKKVSSVSDAAMLLGITRVKSVAVGIAVMSTLTRQPMGRLDLQKLWLHSLGVALAMRILARAMPARTRPLDDEIFLAGLLHDIGYMVLNFLDPKQSDELQARLAANPERPAQEVEAELLEVGHAELGAELAKHWDLPEDVAVILRYHHSPTNEAAGSGQPLVSMVNLAEKLLTSFGITEFVESAIADEEWEALGINPERAEEITEAILAQSEQAKQLAATFG